ncbi:13987_t:CDS:2, partial [Rhizophagus irregularis]
FRMEAIDDFSWNSEVPDGTYQRYWNSEMEPIKDIEIRRFRMKPIDDFWNSEVPDGTY